MSSQKIPENIWKAACENIREPLAIVGLDNKFIWVNKSFEQFTGYPLAELSAKSWMDITVTDDVGGDLASVTSIMNGKSNSYIMDKRYMHRRGHEIDVTIVVRRWPNEPEDIAMFYVEAIPPAVSKYELDGIVRELTGRIISIESGLPRSNKSVLNSDNDSQKVRYFAIGFLALLGMIMYLFYCLVMLQLRQTPESPNRHTLQNTVMVEEIQLCLRQ